MDSDDLLLIGGEVIPEGFRFAADKTPAERRDARDHLRELVAAGARPQAALALACDVLGVEPPADPAVLESVADWDVACTVRLLPEEAQGRLCSLAARFNKEPADMLAIAVNLLARGVDRILAPAEKQPPSLRAEIIETFRRQLEQNPDILN